jgi:hypothetical protein
MTERVLPPCCLSCLYYCEGTSPAFPTADGMCRRYAPQGPTRSHEHGWQIFPPMMKHHWCGDYQPDPKVADAWEAAAAERSAA